MATKHLDTKPNWFGHVQGDFLTEKGKYDTKSYVYVLNAHYLLTPAWWRARTPDERYLQYNAAVKPGWRKGRGFNCGWDSLSGGERENITIALVDAGMWTAEEIEAAAKAWPNPA